jgi:hypothetical protein
MIWILPTDIAGADRTEGHAARVGVQGCGEDNITTNLHETG